MIADLACNEGPLPRDVLELRVAKAHGFSSTQRNIRDRIGVCLGKVELQDEDGRTFVWAKGSHVPRTPWRGLAQRKLVDISRHELAELFDRHADRLRAAEDPVWLATRLAGVERLMATTRTHVEAQYAWWLANPSWGQDDAVAPEDDSSD